MGHISIKKITPTDNTPISLTFLSIIYYSGSTAQAKDGKNGPSTESAKLKQASNPQSIAQEKDGKDGASTEAAKHKQASSRQGTGSEL